MNEKASRETQLDKILLKMALYYEREMDNELIALYHNLLEEFAVEDIGAACSIWMKTSGWYPKVSEIIDIINKHRDPVLSIESRAQQQWRLVLEQIRLRGMRQGTPAFEDPITKYLIRTQFSWSYLCRMKETDENWEQKRFCESYAVADEIGADRLSLAAPEKVLKIA